MTAQRKELDTELVATGNVEHNSESWFCSRSLRSDLQRKTISGGVSSIASQVITASLNLLSIAILSRLLTPDDYGLIALAAVFSAFAGMFVSAGLDLATIQREEITEQQVSNLFWVSVAFSSAIAVLLIAVAPVIAWFNNDPRLTSVISVSAITLVILGLTVQHQALLIRKWLYHRLVVIQITSTVVSQAVAILIAWQWRSYWALVVLGVMFAACRAIMTFCFVPWRPRRFRLGAGSRQMIEFGSNLLGFNVMNYFARNADNLLIGTFCGYRQLGVYAQAYRLFVVPITQLNSPLKRVVMPALSRLQVEPTRYRAAFLRILKLVSMATMPLAATAVVHSDLVIFTVLGEQWAAAVPIFAWLGLSAITQSAFDSLSWLFISQGRTNEYFRWGIVNTLLLLASFLAGLPWDAVGVAISYSLVFYLVCMPFGFWMAGRRGPVRTSDIWQTLVEPAVLAVGAAAGSLVARTLLPITNRCGLCLLVFMTSALICLAYFVFQKEELENIVRTFRKRASSAPENP